MDKLIEKDHWEPDRTCIRTLPARLLESETVFFLDPPAAECLQNVLDRIGTDLPDFPYIEETPDPEFIEYVRSFSETRLPILRFLLESCQGFSPYICFVPETKRNYLATLPQYCDLRPAADGSRVKTHA